MEDGHCWGCPEFARELALDLRAMAAEAVLVRRQELVTRRLLTSGPANGGGCCSALVTTQWTF